MTRPASSGVSGSHVPRLLAVALACLLLAGLAGCGAGHTVASAAGNDEKTLVIGAIPDQDQNKLQQIYGTLADYLSDRLGVRVVYRPVTDYTAAVSQFRTGDLDLVWFGGLTGVQARLQTPGARALVQRNIDDQFHSLFIASTSSGLHPVHDVSGLTELGGTRFTYGSNASTSGFLMPAYYLSQAGVDPQKGFAGPPGFSGSHDKTIDLVESGSYQAGAVNAQVWRSRVKAGTVDTSKVDVIWRTPAFHDYHWVIGPTAKEKFGAGFAGRVRRAFLAISSKDPKGRRLLALFGCRSFVPTDASNYARIEAIGRRLGLVHAQ